MDTKKLSKESLYLMIATTFAFIAMVLTNILSETLPIGGVTNAEVSDKYLSLFTPAGLTFSIWGVIYALLAFYTIRQFSKNSREVAKDVGLLYMLSSVLNIAWIFTWHYELLVLSFIVIGALLVTLAIISRRLDRASMMTRIPFSVYFGWITVATIANFMVVLNATFEKFGGSLLEIMLTISAVIVAGIIGGIQIKYKNDYAYGITMIWSLSGIIINQYKLYDGYYLGILMACFISIGIVMFALVMNFSDSAGRYELNRKTL